MITRDGTKAFIEGEAGWSRTFMWARKVGGQRYMVWKSTLRYRMDDKLDPRDILTEGTDNG